MKKIYLLGLAPLLLLGGAGRASAAPAAALYLVPATATVSAGQQVNVEVHENSGSEPVNIAQIKLTYPASQLKFVMSVTGPYFTALPLSQDSTDNGVVQMTREAFPVNGQPGPEGDQLIVTITFQILPTMENINANFDGPQTILSAISQTNIATSVSGAVYTLAKPPPPPPTPKITIKPPPIITTRTLTSEITSKVTKSSSVTPKLVTRVDPLKMEYVGKSSLRLLKPAPRAPDGLSGSAALILVIVTLITLL